MAIETFRQHFFQAIMPSSIRESRESRDLGSEFYGILSDTFEGVISFSVHVKKELVILPQRLPVGDGEQRDTHLVEGQGM